MMTGKEQSADAVYELISAYELGNGGDSLDELLGPELRAVIPAHFHGVLTLERLGDAIEKSVAAIDDAGARDAARHRWHSTKLKALDSADTAARGAAAANLTDSDFADPAVIARFR